MGHLLSEAAGGLHRDLKTQDLKGCVGFELAERPCCQSSSPVCAARGSCSKAHSHINSPRIGDVLNIREAQSGSLWIGGDQGRLCRVSDIGAGSPMMSGNSQTG